MDAGFDVIGLDNLNPYYDPRLKQARIDSLVDQGAFEFHRLDLTDVAGMQALFNRRRPKCVIHLAAQAGVRHSIDDPRAYVRSNLDGFLTILELCRATMTSHLVYASSSSVYGGSVRLPYAETDPVGHPVSFYAASKRANELMAHTYAHLYGLPATALRFFTVYGPWGRPDMAYWTFAEAIMANQPITLYNHGCVARDFTYVDDVIRAVLLTAGCPPSSDPAFDRRAADLAHSWAPHVIYNVGNNRREPIERLVTVLEAALGRSALRNYAPMRLGDVAETFADISQLADDLKWRPTTPIDVGVPLFVDWWRDWKTLR